MYSRRAGIHLLAELLGTHERMGSFKDDLMAYSLCIFIFGNCIISQNLKIFVGHSVKATDGHVRKQRKQEDLKWYSRQAMQIKKQSRHRGCILYIKSTTLRKIINWILLPLGYFYFSWWINCLILELHRNRNRKQKKTIFLRIDD